MKKYLLKVLLLSFLAFTFISCDSDDDIKPWVEPDAKIGAYILNCGNWGQSDGSLSFYDMNKKALSENVFYNMNDKLLLGDLAQDMVIYGSKMYISVTASNKIYITDLNGKLLEKDGEKAILNPLDGKQTLEPRSTIAYNGKVYVTTQKGYVLRIDTTMMGIDNKVKVGSYPEQMVVSDGKLFVANSGQNYDNKISVIDINSFTVAKTIELPAYNPANMAVDNNGNVYILCLAVYGGANSSLYKMNPNTYAVTKLADDIATGMAMTKNKDRLLLMHQDYAANTTNFKYYDVVKGEMADKSFITDDTKIVAGNSISVNPSNGDVYVGEAIYPSKGKMYVFSEGGKLLNQFSSGGYYPMGAYFITVTK